MNLINGCVYAILLTCLTGNIWTIIWFIACRFLKDKGNVRLIYNLLKVAMMGYFVPFLFGGKLLIQYLTNSSTSFLFCETPSIQMVFLIAFIVWLLGVIVNSLSLLREWSIFSGIRKKRVPVLKEEQALVDAIRAQLGIRKSIRAYNGYATIVPFIYGVFQPRIYLPDISGFTWEEKEMIIMHELVHYKQRDVVWKPLIICGCCIYWFNPLSWMLSKQFQKWAEANCDAFCCARHSMKRYFGTIFKMLDSESRQVGMFAPTWHEGESEFEWRLRYMIKNKGKRLRKWTAVLVAMGIVMMSGVSAYAAEKGVEQVYDYCFWATTATTEEEAEPIAESEEYYGDISEFDDMTVVEGEVKTTARSTIGSFNWTVANNTVMKTSAFTRSTGDVLTVMALVDPEDARVKIGIIQPDGSTRYLFVYSSMYHEFTLTQSGSYRVFVSNDSGTAVTVSGSYR